MVRTSSASVCDCDFKQLLSPTQLSNLIVFRKTFAFSDSSRLPRSNLMYHECTARVCEVAMLLTELFYHKQLLGLDLGPADQRGGGGGAG